MDTPPNILPSFTDLKLQAHPKLPSRQPSLKLALLPRAATKLEPRTSNLNTTTSSSALHLANLHTYLPANLAAEHTPVFTASPCTIPFLPSHAARQKDTVNFHHTTRSSQPRLHLPSQLVEGAHFPSFTNRENQEPSAPVAHTTTSPNKTGKMSFMPINPRPFLQDLVSKPIQVRLKWGQEYKGTLVSADAYMNLQLVNAEEYIDDKMTGALGQVLIRCNNVLWIRGADVDAGSGADAQGDSTMGG
ncbi:hypothetical protein MKZ38_002322 [Zalerion maritima]|uniref:Sm protein F n=1 Tax=Zalerion maritima TaxID=339359 RepID=A0AAD5RYP2_9PEZI|nr:hypothetical protein MKZ38_002322 [Zalerion maritima]